MKTWFSGKSNESPVAVVESPLIKPTAYSPTIAGAEGISIRDYINLAERCGVKTNPIGNMKMVDWIREHHHSYRWDEVYAYMNELAKRESSKHGKKISWLWRPLRNQDILGANWAVGNIKISQEVYKRIVPAPVLMTVEKLVTEFGDAVKFYVSDYDLPQPDPFLAAAIYHEWEVIERWDEPGFRG